MSKKQWLDMVINTYDTLLLMNEAEEQIGCRLCGYNLEYDRRIQIYNRNCDALKELAEAVGEEVKTYGCRKGFTYRDYFIFMLEEEEES